MATRSPSPTKKQIGIRLPARLSNQLDALAVREHNSVSSIVRRLLTTAIRRERRARQADSNDEADR
jgi:metal-responsive CopG/Arc/MetJ family transcriptional regulator